MTARLAIHAQIHLQWHFMAGSSVNLYVRSPDGSRAGPFEASQVRESYLEGKIPSEAMIRPEEDPVLWIPIASVFDASASLNQSLRQLARERAFQRFNAWLKFAAWIFVPIFVMGLLVYLGLAIILRELSKGPNWNEHRGAPLRKAERQAREMRLEELTAQYKAVINGLEISKEREAECKALQIMMKNEQVALKSFEDLGTKVVFYHLEQGSMELEKLSVLESEALALPSPSWIYFGTEGLGLYLADHAALQSASKEREIAYRQAAIAHEKAGAVTLWSKKQEYLDLQIDAVKSVLKSGGQQDKIETRRH